MYLSLPCQHLPYSLLNGLLAYPCEQMLGDGCQQQTHLAFAHVVFRLRFAERELLPEFRRFRVELLVGACNQAHRHILHNHRWERELRWSSRLAEGATP